MNRYMHDMHLSVHLRWLTIATTGLLLAGGAVAQEFCVTCSGPDAQYRCLIGGEATPSARPSRGQFLCITALAKDGNHASCSATRAQATPCPGPTRTVMFQPDDGSGASPMAEGTAPLTPVAPAPLTPISPVPLPPAGAPVGTAQPAAPQPQPAPPAEAKPNMVEDLANKTGKAMNDTSKAVGGAVKKSWDCVASLFGNC